MLHSSMLERRAFIPSTLLLVAFLGALTTPAFTTVMLCVTFMGSGLIEGPLAASGNQFVGLGV